MTWSGHQAFCPYLFCLSQEGNNLQAADWMTDVKQDLSWPILLLASFSTTLQNWFLENKSSCYIMLYRWVAACCRSLSSWHLVLCSQSLSLSPRLSQPVYTVYLAQAVAIILARFVSGHFGDFGAALLWRLSCMIGHSSLSSFSLTCITPWSIICSKASR